MNKIDKAYLKLALKCWVNAYQEPREPKYYYYSPKKMNKYKAKMKKIKVRFAELGRKPDMICYLADCLGLEEEAMRYKIIDRHQNKND